MGQEIITYLIVAIAVGIAIWKTVITLTVKKGKSTATDFTKEDFKMVHDCNDCVADCSLRNAAPRVKNESAEECATNVKLKDS
jgi:hypothetical protein